MPDVIRFPARAAPVAADPAPVPPARPRAGSAPVASLALLLRGAPPDLAPDAVAARMLDAGTNAAAAPIWMDARHRWARLVISRGLRGIAVDRACDGYRDAVRAAGIAEKARRRTHAEALAAWIRAGGLHEDADNAS